MIFPTDGQRRNVRARYWVFTLNNYTDEHIERLKDMINDERFAFISFGKEVGDLGTPHLQGQLELNQRLRWNQVMEILALPIWIDKRKGTFQQAQDYIEKEGDHQCLGKRVSAGAGSRSDLDDLKQSLDERVPLREIANDHFAHFLRYNRGIFLYRALHAIPRTWEMSVIVYWGKTGTGKTRAVYDNLPTLDMLWKGASFKWFDGYDGHPFVLFDEFKGSKCDITYLLELLDRYPMSVPIKGGMVNWSPQEIYITSNMHPNTWYSGALLEHQRALMRRITNIFEF